MYRNLLVGIVHFYYEQFDTIELYLLMVVTQREGNN